VGDYIDQLVETQNENVIWNTILTLSVIWSLQIILSYAKNWVMSNLHSKVCIQITQKVLEHVSKLPFSFFASTDHAALNQRILFDAKSITGYILGDIEGVISSVLTIGCAGWLILIRDNGVIIILVLLMPLYIIIFLFFKSPLYQLKLKVSEEYSRYYASTDRFLANIKSIMDICR
jgi:ATP-binding cassette subfamily C protein